MRSVFRCLPVVLALVSMAAPPVDAQDAQTVYQAGDGVTLPVVVTLIRPVYTPEARDAHIEGTVLLDCVVRADGTVGDVDIARSLDPVYGLDTQAVNAVKQSTFKPGTKDGRPVAVRVQINTKFTLH